MKINIKILLGAAVCVVVIIGAGWFIKNNYDNGGMDMTNRRITATQAHTMMKRYPNAIILDVRTQQEFATGHIPGAILLPDYEIQDRAGYVLPNHDALILIYCRSGARSSSATSLLVSMGYTNVYDFGGINNWPYEKEGA